MSGYAKSLVDCRAVVYFEEVHTKREFSRRLKQSSITTSSSEPRISEILPAIHLRTELLLSATQIGGVDVDQLLHDLNVNLLHVHFLAKFWRELCPL
jgi:hypothetical protein